MRPNIVNVHNPDGVPQHDAHGFCERMRTWANAAIAAGHLGAGAWQSVEGALFKSSLARRLIYEGEELRTEKCPVHKGRWSGLFHAKPEGCLCMSEDGAEATGWIRKESPGRPA